MKGVWEMENLALNPMEIKLAEQIVEENEFTETPGLRLLQIAPFICGFYDLIIISTDSSSKVYKNLSQKLAFTLLEQWGKCPVIAIHKNEVDENDDNRLQVYILDIYSGYLD